MGRILFWLLIAVLFWWFVKGLLKSRDRSDAPPPAQSTHGEDMVACARCGVNLPRSDAREEGGKYFCLNNPQCIR